MRASTIAAALLCAACGGAGPSGQCLTSADCAAGQSCDYERGLCLAAAGADAGAQACQSNGDCPSGLCQGGACACTQDTWTSYASGVLSANCGRCHGFAASRTATASEAAAIRANLEAGTMPPSGALPQSESDRLVRWIDCGLPQ